MRRSSQISFSFTRPGAALDAAREDMAAVLDNLIARREAGLALGEATARYRASGEQADWDEQQRLLREADRIGETIKSLAHARREAGAAL